MSNRKRIKVLFLIPTLTGGGAERVVVTLLNHLSRVDFLLSIAIVDTRHAVFRDQIPPHVEFIDLRCSRVRYALPKIVRLVWRQRPDVVFSTLGHLNLALAILRPLLPNNVNYVARETALVSQGLAGYRWPQLWASAYRRFYGVFDRIVCQSNAMRDDLLRVSLMPPEKTIVINNPIDIEQVRLLATSCKPVLPSEHGKSWIKPVNLVAAGRLSHEKGFDILIEALSLTSNRHIHLTILGEGPLMTELESLVQTKGLIGRVHFLGFQTNPYSYIAQADAFVLSSRHEGFPNVVIEALALQTPVVALPSPGGIREILDGINGCVLTKDMSAQTLAIALDAIVPGQRLASDAASPYALKDMVCKYERELLT